MTADFWKLSATLARLNDIVDRVAAHPASFDGTTDQKFFVQLVHAQAALAMGRSNAPALLGALLAQIEKTVPIENGKPEDASDMVNKAASSSDRARAAAGNLAQWVAQPLLSDLAKGLPKDQARRSYDLLQRSFFMKMSSSSVCNDQDYVSLAVRLGQQALDLDRTKDADGFVNSESALCADLRSAANLSRADTLVLEGRYLTERGDRYNAEYALLRGRWILDQIHAQDDGGVRQRLELALGGLLAGEGRDEAAGVAFDRYADLVALGAGNQGRGDEALFDRAIVLVAGARGDTRGNATAALSKLLQLHQNSDAAAAFEDRVERAVLGETSAAAEALRAYQDKRYQLALLQERAAQILDLPKVAAAELRQQHDVVAAEIATLRSEAKALLAKAHADDSVVGSVGPRYTASLREIGTVLGEDEALVQIAAGPDEIVTIVSRKGEHADVVVTSQNRSALAAELQAFEDNVRTRKSEGAPQQPFDLKSAAHLYDLLIRPIRPFLAGVKTLYVVADDDISRLPFYALVTEPVAGAPRGSLRDVPFLIKQPIAISILPSASVLIRGQSIAPSKAGNMALAVAANPVDQPSAEACRATGSMPTAQGTPAVNVPALRCALRRLGPLGKSATFTQTLTRAIGPWGHVTPIEPDGHDTVAAFSAKPLADYGLIAIMAHSIPADPAIGLPEPALVFRLPDEPGRAADALLTPSRISALHLNADLVLLLGCDTAAPRAGVQQTLSGLARAFLESGARSLVVTQWVIRPETVPYFSRAFFEAAGSGQATAEALRRAALSFLDQNRVSLDTWTHPFFWAGFTSIGPAVHLKAPSSSPDRH